MANAHWPLAPVANGHWPLLLYKPYTSDTRWVKVFQSVYSYTTLYSIQLYIAIHYTPSTTPLSLEAERRQIPCLHLPLEYPWGALPADDTSG